MSSYPPVLGNPSALIYGGCACSVLCKDIPPPLYLTLCMHRNAISETCRDLQPPKTTGYIYIITVPFICPFHPPPTIRPFPPSCSTPLQYLGIDLINFCQLPFRELIVETCFIQLALDRFLKH